MEPKGSLSCHNSLPLVPILSQMHSKSEALNNISKYTDFYDELLAPCPTPKTGVPTLSGCLWLLIQYTCSYSIYLKAISSTCNLTMQHSKMRRTHMERFALFYYNSKNTTLAHYIGVLPLLTALQEDLSEIFFNHFS
jgi:hypothetical protein